jgi:hypothetical protein
MSEISFPTFRNYADRCKASFLPIRARRYPDKNPHVEKFQIGEILECYDVILWVDCDALITRRAPSIFDLVEKGHFAAFDEGKETGVMVDKEFELVSAALGVEPPKSRPFYYFNSGVMLAWKCHKSVFAPPPPVIPTVSGINDQTLINVRVALSGTPFTSLGREWNMIWCPFGFESSFIIHHASRKVDENLLLEMENRAKRIC